MNVTRLNGAAVRAEDLRAVMEAAAARPKRRRSFEALAELAVEILPDVSPSYRAALMFRLEALNNLLGSGGVPGFTSQGPEKGLSLISDGAISAAAKCKLYSDDGHRVIFEPDEFSREALRAADTEGRG